MEKIEISENLHNLQNHDLGNFDITASANREVGDLDKLDGIDCPICHNKGYILADDDNGVTQSVVTCQCMHKRKIKRLSEESGMGALLKFRVKDFETEERWQKVAQYRAIQYIQTDAADWFVMLGQSGSGKTHLCSAVCNALIESYHDVRYIAWNDFADWYMDNKFDPVAKAKLQELQQVEVLYIDDLFKGANGEYQIKNIAFNLINYRYNNRLRTIISSECSANDLCKLDEAIASRIVERAGEYLIQIPKTPANNYRLKK